MTGMDDLVTWFRAELDRQEAALIAYRDHRAGLTPCDNLDDYDSCSEHIRTARATEYRDVAYGLAEVDAKRRVLDWLVDCEGKALDGNWWNLEVADAVKALALPMAARDGYREEWQP